MPASIDCPTCRRPLQVPEEYVGRMVQCPACGSTFLTTVARPVAERERIAPIPAERQPEVPEEAGPVLNAVDVEMVKGTIAAPAICLLLLGGAGFLVSIWNLILVLNGAWREAMLRQPAPDPQVRELRQRLIDIMTGPFGIGWQVAFIAVNLVIFLGAVAMFRRRFFGLAVTASICALLDFQCCCVVGLPFGIWSLMVLTRPDVRAAFD